MVLLVLHVKAELENIESITFPPDIQYCFDVKDAQSDEEKKGVFLCADEIAEVDGSKGDANFAMRFPDCKKQCTVTFTDVKGVTRDTITAEDSGNFVPIEDSTAEDWSSPSGPPPRASSSRPPEAPSGRTWTSARIPTDGSNIARSAARAWASPNWSSRSEPTRPSRVRDVARGGGDLRAPRTVSTRTP